MKTNLAFQPMIVYPTTVYTSTQIKNNVIKIFQEILRRLPSSTELTQWADAIKKNIYAYRDLQNTLYASDEFIQRSAEAGVTTPEAEPIIEIREKKKAGIFVAVSTGVLWVLSLI
jgi:hypothetical protein